MMISLQNLCKFKRCAVRCFQRGKFCISVEVAWRGSFINTVELKNIFFYQDIKSVYRYQCGVSWGRVCHQLSYPV